MASQLYLLLIEQYFLSNLVNLIYDKKKFGEYKTSGREQQERHLCDYLLLHM